MSAPERLWVVTVSGEVSRTFANKEEAGHWAMALLLEGKEVDRAEYIPVPRDRGQR